MHRNRFKKYNISSIVCNSNKKSAIIIERREN